MEWTEERVAQLTRLWQDGFSASQVARQLGDCSRSGVIGKVHRLGIAERRLPTRPRDVGHRREGFPKPSLGRSSPRSLPRPQAVRPAAVFEVAATATLTTLTECGCRWPIGEPDHADFGFCGRVRAGRGSYCEGHSPLASSRRVSALPVKQIERLLERYGDTPTASLRFAANF